MDMTPCELAVSEKLGSKVSGKPQTRLLPSYTMTLPFRERLSSECRTYTCKDLYCLEPHVLLQVLKLCKGSPQSRSWGDDYLVISMPNISFCYVSLTDA